MKETQNNSSSNEIKAGKTHSIWIDTTPKTEFDALDKDVSTEVLVIGGGITGLITAYLLSQAGIKVILIDVKRLASDTTGHTTAKITTLQGFLYQTLIKNFGADGATMYAQANLQALEKIKAIASENKIDCDLETQTAYSYTIEPNNLPKIEAELEATQKAGLRTSFTSQTGLPFDVKGAVKLEAQAQFHPRKFLLALADILNVKDNRIFEKTMAKQIEESKDEVVVKTEKAIIKAKNVVLATHFPFYDKGFFYARMYPYRAYASGLRLADPVPEGLHYNSDSEVMSIRNQATTDGKIMIFGDGYHHSGKVSDTLSIYKKLLHQAKRYFNVSSTDYYWSTQDYYTVDGVPFIGLSPRSNRIYVACGFGGWGMTNGVAAAIIISDLIQGRKNPWQSVYDPSRKNLTKQTGKLISENTGVMTDYFKGLLSTHQQLEELPKQEGRVVRIKGRRVAISKDEKGDLRAVSAVCPHMACTVNWNNAEQSWDCPCHGSRFDADGRVIHGPALNNLKESKL